MSYRRHDPEQGCGIIVLAAIVLGAIAAAFVIGAIAGSILHGIFGRLAI